MRVSRFPLIAILISFAVIAGCKNETAQKDAGKTSDKKDTAAQSTPSESSSASAPSSAEAASMLKEAFGAMNKVKSFHIVAQLRADQAVSDIDGVFGPNSLDITQTVGDKMMKYIAVNKIVYQSQDGGATWKNLELNENNGAVQISKAITAPFEAGVMVVDSSELKVIGYEEIEGVQALHIVAEPKSGKGSVSHFWVADGKGGKEIRQLEMDVEATDVSFHMKNKYTKVNEPVEIKAPI